MSARFVFRLSRIMRHRQRVEDARARAMRQAIDRHEDASVRQATVERAAEAARVALTTDAARGLTGASVRTHAAGVRDLHGRARAAALVTEAEATRVEERRAELVEAAQARRVLERLEEVKRAAWRADLNRADQRENDEIALRRPRP